VQRIAGRLGVGPARRSPLQRELDRLVRIMLVVALGLIGVTVGAGVLRGHPAGANVLAGISAAIAAIPEEPPILLAVILGLGAHRLMRRQVLVRRLSAEETLGAVDLIVTDKTGTLTENRLALAEILDPSGPILDLSRRRAIIELALRSEDEAWRTTDSTGTRGSFTRALAAVLDAIGAPLPRLDPTDLVDSSPPSDGRPFSMTTARGGLGLHRVVLGAPEAVLARCGALGDTDRDNWHVRTELEAGRGARLLLLAEAWDADPLRPVAVLAFADPIRDGVRSALGVTRTAGIQTIVVTGDHPATAIAIARAAGLGASNVVTGQQLAGWADDRLDAELTSIDIVARAVPEDKLRLVDAARRTGRTVAVTGDGVNDAPALQRADVAVAMGSGSAVAKGASDLVLGDDSFATLVYAIREGRRLVANVQKGLVFLISTHVALLGFILIATIAGYDQPLLPIQILWLELFIDISASVAFEREPEEPASMRVAPRPRHVSLLTTGLLVRIAIAGGFTAMAALAILATGSVGEHARWLAFTTLVVGQAVRAYANRSLNRPVRGLATNRLLLVTCVAMVLIQAAIPAIPALASMFRASPLGVMDWLVVEGVALAPFLLAEVLRGTRRVVWVA
jgi:magnesium-transporting ATPase (P-type)